MSGVWPAHCPFSCHDFTGDIDCYMRKLSIQADPIIRYIRSILRL